MYTNGKAKGEVANYIGFIQSERGQQIVQEQGSHQHQVIDYENNR